MSNFNIPAHLLLAAALLAGSLPAQAGGDHDHAHDAAAPAATGPALPRFSAESESFELVGELDGRRLTLYLDRYADNAPVPGARIELDIGGQRLSATPTADAAVYVLQLPKAPAPGVLQIAASVSVGQESDLLAAELDVHAAADAQAAQHAWPWAGAGGKAVPALAALTALLALLALAAWRARRRAARRRTGPPPAPPRPQPQPQPALTEGDAA